MRSWNTPIKLPEGVNASTSPTSITMMKPRRPFSEDRREHYRALSHRRLRAWPLPVMLRSVVLIDVDYKATILPSAFTHAVRGGTRKITNQ
jgi:hypothetical protein